MRACGVDVGKKLRPQQLGCGTRGGAEIAARIAQLVVDEAQENFRDTVIISFDIKNAFGTMPRRFMMEGILKHYPGLAKFFSWAYGGTGILVDNDRIQVASNATGCRQGDPLAGLCFCLGLQEVLEEGLTELCKEVMKLDGQHQTHLRRFAGLAELLDKDPSSLPLKLLASAIHGFLTFMDDLFFMTHSKYARKIILGVAGILKGYGLIVQVTKTTVKICDRGADFNPADISDLNVSVVWPEECTEILGVPVGDRMACRRWLCHALEKRILPVARGLRGLNPAAAFNLLRYCLNTKAGYWTRVLEPEISFGPLSFFDTAIDGILLQIMGLVPQEFVIMLGFEEETFFFSNAADGRIGIALRNLRELRDLPMRQGGFGIVRHSGVFGDAAVASSRAFAVRFLGKVHFGDFIRERAQSKWLGEDTRILIGGSRRRQLFEKATDDLFLVPATSTMSLDDRLACLIDAAVGTILDVSDPLDPWVSRQQVDTIIPPVTMQVIPGTDVNDASIPIIVRNPNNHDDGEEDLYEGCTRRSSYAIALSDTHRRVLRLADKSFIDASDPVCREEVRLLCEKVHDARARAFHERLLDSSRYQQALWFACSRFRGSGAFLMGASQALYGLADFYGHPQEWREAACARLLLPPVPPINGSYIRRCQCGHDIDFQIDCFHWHQCSASNRSIFQTRHAMVKRALLRALKSHVVSERVESVQDEPLLPHRRESPPATAAGSGTHGVASTAPPAAAVVAAAAATQQQQDAVVVGGAAAPSSPLSTRTRADILIKRRNPGGVVLLSEYIDVAITSPSAGLSDAERIKAANRFHDPGAAIVKRANKKRADYKRVAPHLEIVPFVMDCTGRAGQDAAAFMAGVTGENKYLSRSVFAHLGALIALFNARTVLFLRKKYADG